jgi:hypothetical protein
VLGRGQRKHCALCGVEISRTNLVELARRGRVVAESAESRNRMSISQKRQQAKRRGWIPSKLPAWLTQESYRLNTVPLLGMVAVPTIARLLKVSEPYAAKVRKGQHVPHPMHWLKLAKLVEFPQASDRSRSIERD